MRRGMLWFWAIYVVLMLFFAIIEAYAWRAWFFWDATMVVFGAFVWRHWWKRG